MAIAATLPQGSIGGSCSIESRLTNDSIPCIAGCGEGL